MQKEEERCCSAFKTMQSGIEGREVFLCPYSEGWEGGVALPSKRSRRDSSRGRYRDVGKKTETARCRWGFMGIERGSQSQIEFPRW
jgi:hypothetical protein